MDAELEPWRLIRSGPCDPFFNMGLDEALMLNAAAPPTLRFYEWTPPCISLGVTQSTADFDPAEIRARGFAFTRRATGGGAIAHRHELTYSIAVPERHSSVDPNLKMSYVMFHDPILAALEELGIEARHRNEGDGDEDHPFCFMRHADFDIVVNGRKIGGSAQRRKNGRLLQHGSLILLPSGWDDGAGCIAEAAGREIEPDELADAIARNFEGCFECDLIESAPTAAELTHAAELAKTYASPAWINKK